MKVLAIFQGLLRSNRIPECIESVKNKLEQEGHEVTTLLLTWEPNASAHYSKENLEENLKNHVHHFVYIHQPAKETIIKGISDLYPFFLHQLPMFFEKMGEAFFAPYNVIIRTRNDLIIDIADYSDYMNYIVENPKTSVFAPPSLWCNNPNDHFGMFSKESFLALLKIMTRENLNIVGKDSIDNEDINIKMTNQIAPTRIIGNITRYIITGGRNSTFIQYI